MNIVPLILSGGAGTRLWPLSRSGIPKQFLSLVGPGTLFQQAVGRVINRAIFTPPLVLAAAMQEAVVAAQLQSAGVVDATIVLEPCSRSTTAAAAVAAILAARMQPDAL